MDDDDASGAVAVRVRVFFGRTAVGSPASVADAVGSFKWLITKGFLEVMQLAGGAAHLQQGAGASHGNARRVIASIFEPAKTLNDDRDDPFLPYVTYNSTHARNPM